MLRPPALLAAALVVLGASACNDDGRTLAPASTAPVPQTTSTTPDVRQLTLTSPAFDDGGFLDPTFTCDGIDVSPPLAIAGAPDATVELAVVVTDANAGGYVHWVIAGLAPDLRMLESGQIPVDARVIAGDGGVEGWQGPCPPAGDEPHAYEFALHALAEPSGLAPDVDAKRAAQLLQEAALASDSIVGFYERAQP